MFIHIAELAAVAVVAYYVGAHGVSTSVKTELAKIEATASADVKALAAKIKAIV